MTITLKELLPHRISEFEGIIRAANRKRLGDVTLFDLILNESEAHPHHHGVYLFTSSGGDQILYVGRVKSPQFIERLPSHFALGEDSWQNQFLKHHRKSIGVVSLREAAVAAADCELLLVLAPQGNATELEALLIHVLKPIYNKRLPKVRPFAPNAALQEILGISE